MFDENTKLETLDEYLKTRAHLFPSEESLKWFIRQNRDELIEAGALLRPTGRWLVQPSSFDRTILAIGKRRAKRH